ncbi:hypothetical protein B0H17DRAFT_1136902 [Mycena rosella]|uniref:Uncharacterized protein n=1 Tax=Mycena rosella TaxID=1033263 RepID=A0AAD7D9Z6_MYCRO|nr:hypothetical protein B0H17DRAFT_1136902 [Mycena rosella]
MSAFAFRLPASSDAPKQAALHVPLQPSASSTSSTRSDASNDTFYMFQPPEVPPEAPKFNTAPLFTIPGYDTVPPSMPPTGIDEIGSFEYDGAHNSVLRWPSLRDMHSWKTQECADKCIEFVKKASPLPGTDAPWTATHIYRQRKEIPAEELVDEESNLEAYWMSLSVDSQDLSRDLGGPWFYKPDHSHSIGDENVKFTRLDPEIRKEIESLLRLGIEPKKTMLRNPEAQTNSQHSASSAADPCPITEIAVVYVFAECRRTVAVHSTNDHNNWNCKVEQKFWLTVLKPFVDTVID